MNDGTGKVAIVGRAGRFPGARSVDELWSNLVRGVESVRTLSEEDLLRASVDRTTFSRPDYVRASATIDGVWDFDAAFFGFSPRDGAILDPQHRHFLECAHAALEDAALDPSTFPGAIGVFAGSGHNAYLAAHLLSNRELVESVGTFLLRHTGNDKDFLPTRVSYLLNLRGPSVAVQTACSTSLVAVHLACQSLLSGESDLALAGGVTIELSGDRGYLFEEGGIVSPDGHCRPFDAGAQGTVFGSGIGVVALRRLKDALRDGDPIHAVILSSAVNNDGARKVGYLAPSVDGQAQAATEALSLSGLHPDNISYIEAHGTGTPVGDPIEIAALSQAFRRGTTRTGFCAIGSIKGNIGHLDTAAGIAGLLKVTEALKHRLLPPSLHFTRPNPSIAFDSSPFFVNDRLREWDAPAPRRAALNSLGVGGTNAHAILEEAPPPQLTSAAPRAQQLLLLSAKTPEALDRMTEELASHLKAHPELPLSDVAYTLQVGRRAMRERRALVCYSVLDGAAALRTRAPDRLLGSAVDEEPREVAFLFPGGGAQHPAMARGLYLEEPLFREEIDRCLILLRPLLDSDLASLLGLKDDDPLTTMDAAKLERPAAALPALFMVEYALSKLLMTWGVRPVAMLGHSMGEYTAACLAGVFSLPEALQLVTLRGQLFERLPEGGMLSVPLPFAELRPLLGPDLQLAAVNAPSACVASGPTSAIAQLQRRLTDRGIEGRRLHIGVAAHSAMLDPILSEFRSFLRSLSPKPPRIPFLSNVSGGMISAAEATDPEYWVRHLRETVRFSDGITQIAKDPRRVLLEVGPSGALCTFARAQLGARAVFPAMPHSKDGGDDGAFLLNAIARLWLSGVPVDFRALAGGPRQRLSLPTYPFARVRHLIEPGLSAEAERAPSLRKQADIGRWFHIPAWRPVPILESAPPVDDRWLIIADRCEADGLGARVAADLRRCGAGAILVSPGPGFCVLDEARYAMRPAEPEDYDALLADLSRRGRTPWRILHMLSAAPSGESSLRAFDLAQERGFHSVLALAQALGRADLGHPIDVVVVTSGAEQVAGEALPSPERATVLGPVRVIGREIPGLRCRLLDIELPPAGSPQEERLSTSLQLEFSRRGCDDDQIVAYRGAQRFVQHFVPLALSPAPPGRLREQGTYLITGGTGGIGLSLAEHLCQRYRARVVLLSRTPLPERAAWPAYIEVHGPRDPISQRLLRLRALAEAGGEVLTLATDVSSPPQVLEAVRHARERFGPIHGVFHAAGTIDDGVLLLKTRAAANAVLSPKARGAYALEAALHDAPLDFFALFSSVSSITGLAGQVDYAAANAFLDAFAKSRAAQGSATVALNWNTWKDVGMAAEIGARLGISPPPLAFAAPGSEEGEATGHPLLGHRLRGGPDRLLYSARLDASHWLLLEHRIKGGYALLPGTAYLELARAALPAPLGSAIELRDVLFLSPFIVAPGVERVLRVVLVRAEDGFAFEVCDSDSGVAETYARGLVRAVERPAAPPVDLAAIVARCNVRQIDSPGVAHPHLDFGPRWDNRAQVRYGQGEALLRLVLPPTFADDVETLRLHPALLDMATAGARALLPDGAPPDLYVPLSYGRVLIHAALPTRCYSHVRQKVAHRSETTVFDVALYDEEGRPLVELQDFIMRRVDPAAFAAAPTMRRAWPDSRRGTTSGGRVATGNKILDLGLAEGISASEGMEAIERVLAGPPLPQVVICSQDLRALISATAMVAPAGSPQVPAGQADGRKARPVLLSAYVAPRGPVEEEIAAAWEGLGIKGIGAHDDFFELGGHSLLLTQIIGRVRRRTGTNVPLRVLFERPTVAGLAEEIGSARSAEPQMPIARVSRQDYRVRRSDLGRPKPEAS